MALALTAAAWGQTSWLLLMRQAHQADNQHDWATAQRCYSQALDQLETVPRLHSESTPTGKEERQYLDSLLPDVQDPWIQEHRAQKTPEQAFQDGYLQRERRIYGILARLYGPDNPWTKRVKAALDNLERMRKKSGH